MNTLLEVQTMPVIQSEYQKLAILYQPLPMPRMLWEQSHINFVTKLPEDDGYGIIITCVDSFVRWWF